MLFWAMGGKVFSQSSEVRIVYDYLWVYPNELGTFTEYPSTLVSKLNEQKKYGCSTWRRPTEEELQILRANNLASNSSYFRDGDSWKSDYSKRVLLVTTKEEEMKQRKYDQAQAAKEAAKAAAVRRIEVAKENSKKFVDLGLPSGNKWQFDGGRMRYDDCIEYCKKNYATTPYLKEWDEIFKFCKIEYIERDTDPSDPYSRNGFILKGPNGTEVYIHWGNYLLNYSLSTKNGVEYYDTYVFSNTTGSFRKYISSESRSSAIKFTGVFIRR